MKTFKALAGFSGSYGATCSVGHHYVGEVGTSGVRQGALEDLEDQLVEAFDKARQKQGAQGPAKIDVPGGPGQVKALAQWHEGQSTASKDAAQKTLNDKVIFLRKWLSRQGAWFGPEGRLLWPETLKLRVVYDAELAKQNATRITIKNGGRLHTPDGKFLDTAKFVTHFSGPGKAIYVMSATGNLHVHSHSVGHFHHSSLLAGAPVAGAGEIEVQRGLITWLSNKSGHYRPGRDHLLQVLGMLQSKGVDLAFPLSVVGLGAGDYPSVEEFMKNQLIDDEGFEKALEAARHVKATPADAPTVYGQYRNHGEQHVYRNSSS